MTTQTTDAKSAVPIFASQVANHSPAFGTVLQHGNPSSIADPFRATIESKYPDPSGTERLMALDLPAMSRAGEAFYRNQIGAATALEQEHLAAIEEQQSIIEETANRKKQELAETKDKAVKEYNEARDAIKIKKRKAATAKLDYVHRDHLIQEEVEAEENALTIIKDEHRQAYKNTIGLAEHKKRHWVVPVPPCMLPFSQRGQSFCSICRTIITDDFAACSPGCGHGFCQSCIITILDGDHPTCPDCRTPIIEHWQANFSGRKHQRKISSLEQQVADLQEQLKNASRPSSPHSGNSPQLNNLTLTEGVRQ